MRGGFDYVARSAVNAALVVVALCVAMLAWNSLGAFAASAQLRDLAASIEFGAKPDFGYLMNFIRSKGLDRPQADCGDSLTRAQLTVALAALTASAREKNKVSIATSAGIAQQTVVHRLSCSPLDGNAWLRYAIVLEALRQPRAKVVSALGLSYAFAPNEAWIIEPRILFATFLFVRGEKTLEAQYRKDLTLFSTYMPAQEVAQKYVGSPAAVRDILHAAILDQPTERQKNIVDAIDNLGVVFAPK
jgi:hypothetical protein